jgi:glutamyl-tRNA synthetase
MVRTRIAPSPTGFPHIGTIYQVLFDFAFARQNKGKFICRIEDTDRARFVKGAEKVIFDALDWFGLTPDESPLHGGSFGPYRQSERLGIYQEYAKELISKGHAYYCFCTKERLDQMRQEQNAKKIPPMYDKKCLKLPKEEVEKNISQKVPYVIRLNIPKNRKISFEDMIVGTIEFDSASIDDQVLIKSDGFPTYHMGVVVDDHLMKITHIFRGTEWISSTPKHVLLYEFFGWNMPIHGHMPLILNTDGKGKLSKRHGHASVTFYQEKGFLPEAILNYLSNIVWAHPEEKEIYDITEFIRVLDMKKINSQGARFDLTKLEWMNGEYIRKSNILHLKSKILEYLEKYVPESRGVIDGHFIEKTIPLVQTRIKTLSEYYPMVEFFFKKPESFEKEINTEWMSQTLNVLKNLKSWTHEVMYTELSKLADKLAVSKSKLFMDIRIAITGEKIGLPLFESMELLGKDESVRRLQ